MAATMQTTNSYNDLYNRVQDLQSWAEGEVEDLHKKDKELEDKFVVLIEDVKNTKKFAETAANAGLQVQQSMVTFQKSVADEMAKQTTEILRLISTDALQDKRMETFETHIKEATQTAMKAITMKANEAGTGLAKKVSIPVGAIAAIATIIQWCVQHFHLFDKLFGRRRFFPRGCNGFIVLIRALLRRSDGLVILTWGLLRGRNRLVVRLRFPSLRLFLSQAFILLRRWVLVVEAELLNRVVRHPFFS